MENPLKYFGELRDPRVEGRSEHLLQEMLVITIAGVLSGADSWNEIEDYGKAKEQWLESFLSLPAGIPSTTPSIVFFAITYDIFHTIDLSFF